MGLIFNGLSLIVVRKNVHIILEKMNGGIVGVNCWGKAFYTGILR